MSVERGRNSKRIVHINGMESIQCPSGPELCILYLQMLLVYSSNTVSKSSQNQFKLVQQNGVLK